MSSSISRLVVSQDPPVRIRNRTQFDLVLNRLAKFY